MLNLLVVGRTTLKSKQIYESNVSISLWPRIECLNWMFGFDYVSLVRLNSIR